MRALIKDSNTCRLNSDQLIRIRIKRKQNDGNPFIASEELIDLATEATTSSKPNDIKEGFRREDFEETLEESITNWRYLNRVCWLG